MAEEKLPGVTTSLTWKLWKVHFSQEKKLSKASAFWHHCKFKANKLKSSVKLQIDFHINESFKKLSFFKNCCYALLSVSVSYRVRKLKDTLKVQLK